MLQSTRSDTPDAIAPDGAEIRVLLDRLQGATRLSLAEALVKPGERTAYVSHRTSEDIWYIVRGTGRFHRLTPDGGAEQNAEVAPGDALLIPTGYRFWVENTGSDNLVFLCCGTPPWPGNDEAILWEEDLI
jgi:mannose-6-phosphate isomerase-like protein (cupin superfamily)